MGPGSHHILLGLIRAAVDTVVFAFFLALPGLIDRGVGRRLPHRAEVALATLSEGIRDTRTLLLRPDWRIVGAIGYLWFDIAAATLVYHAIALWVPALWGSIAFIVLRRTRTEPLKLRPPRTARTG